ncbi:hypothetical protein FDECE_2021 [Fusarium decemcellulare]|nr:hypothetical protein FDECE_2021 [Fusarium decemcellulare]
MHVFKITLLLAQLSATLAAPTVVQSYAHALVAVQSATTTTVAITPSATPAEPGAGDGGAGGEEGAEEGAEDEVEQAGEFDVPIVLPGGSKVDTLYPPGQNGVFEIEFQNAEDRTLTVTQNTSPAAPPTGFVAVEPVSFIVSLEGGTEGLTLQKVDFILNSNSTVDISTGSIGRFCAEAGAFVIDPALGEQEFEAEENELLIKVDNMNGEWAVFIPESAPDAGAGAGADAGAGSGEGAAAGDTPITKKELMEVLLSVFG